MNRSSHFIRALFILMTLSQLTHSFAALAQESSYPEAGTVVGTTGLNIRECPEVSCGSEGLAQLKDPITVTGPAEDGFLPVEWKGETGWAWHLYVATDSTGTPFLEAGTPGCNRVAFIFDVGIGEKLQIQALLWLREHNIPATIFPMGWWATDFPDDLRTIAMLGFPIGTHGDVRLNLTGFSDEDIATDLNDSATHIRQVIGTDPVPYFTPYAADADDRVYSVVAQQGYLPVAWDVPADDWDKGITAEYVYDRVVPNVEDGSIVEFHLDGPSSAQSTAVAIPRIVTDLQARGFTFVSIPDMAQPCGAATPVASTPVPLLPEPLASPPQATPGSAG
jgi:peptidoglycan/xylan/chitin deacetylase (PgdA/CDA1 family)